MEQSLLMLVLLVIGFIGLRRALRQIQTGSGWICQVLPAQTLQYLNSPEGRVPKVLLALLLAYIAMAGMIIKGIVTLALSLTDYRG